MTEILIKFKWYKMYFAFLQAFKGIVDGQIDNFHFQLKTLLKKKKT